MKVYLDNNIFIYLENGTLSMYDLEKIIEGDIVTVYSAVHIKETLEIRASSEQQRQERIERRLKTIEKYSKSNYIFKDKENNVFQKIEQPINVLKSINEISYSQNILKGMVNLISDEKKKEIRDALGLDPRLINSYEPKEVVVHLNKKLGNLGQGLSLLELVELGNQNTTYNKHLSTSDRMAAVFELLDLFGYWKDKHNEKSNYARLWDRNHTFYASFCDYFITDDKRTIKKAKVVYDIYDIKTKIKSTKK